MEIKTVKNNQKNYVRWDGLWEPLLSDVTFTALSESCASCDSTQLAQTQRSCVEDKLTEM